MQRINHNRSALTYIIAQDNILITPQTWHFSYTTAPLQLFALQTHLVMASSCSIHPPSLVWSTTLQGVTWIDQDTFPSLTVPRKARSAASSQVPSLLWGRGHVQDRQRKKAFQYPLTFPFRVQGASVCLSYFQSLHFWAKLWRQALFPWLT